MILADRVYLGRFFSAFIPISGDKNASFLLVQDEQSDLFISVVFHMPLGQNNPYAKVAHIEVACSATLQESIRA
jgi:hypothetical protein